MDYLITSTTAINRPELHNIVLPKWIEWLKQSNKKIVWFINIDVIEYLNDDYYTTKQNMETIIGNNVNELIILPQQNDGFLGACKILSTTIKKYVEDNNICKEQLKIIWLEDDWEIINNFDINKLLEYSGKYTHINLTGLIHNYIHALAPSILSYMFWEDIFYNAWSGQKINICPEKCVGKYFFEKYSHITEENMKNITIIRNVIDIDKNFNDIKNENNKFVFFDVLEENVGKYESEKKYATNDQIKDLINSNEYIFIRLYPKMAKDRGIEYAKTKKYRKTYHKKIKYTPYVTYEKI